MVALAGSAAPFGSSSLQLLSMHVAGNLPPLLSYLWSILTSPRSYPMY